MHKKVLFCATVDYHFRAFHLPYMKWFKEQGWEVHVAASGSMDLPFVDKKYDLPITRSPFSLSNYRAFQQLKLIMKENQYGIVHCHTPVGGVIGRLAARTDRATGTKVIYTAHGFHFCHGASLTSWCFYYPVEKYLAQFTDSLITINSEDYELTVNYGFKAKQLIHVHGVGVDTELYKPISETEKLELRNVFEYGQEEVLMFYAAEFNKNKNQKLLIESLSLVRPSCPNVRLLLAGEGPTKEECQKLAKELNLEENIQFLGYRDDVEQLLKICDIAVASSLREGLPVNIMEAMASGLPVIASNSRGHRELIENSRNGWIVDSARKEDMAEKMIMLTKDSNLRNKLGRKNRALIIKKYSINKVLSEQCLIYSEYMKERRGLNWAVH